jgi:hypothetical protein
MELELRQFLPQIKYLPSNPRSLSLPFETFNLGLLEVKHEMLLSAAPFSTRLPTKKLPSTKKRGTIYSLKSGSSIDKSIDVSANWAEYTYLEGIVRVTRGSRGVKDRICSNYNYHLFRLVNHTSSILSTSMETVHQNDRSYAHLT